MRSSTPKSRKHHPRNIIQSSSLYPIPCRREVSCVDAHVHFSISAGWIWSRYRGSVYDDLSCLHVPVDTRACMWVAMQDTAALRHLCVLLLRVAIQGGCSSCVVLVVVDTVFSFPAAHWSCTGVWHALPVHVSVGALLIPCLFCLLSVAPAWIHFLLQPLMYPSIH